MKRAAQMGTGASPHSRQIPPKVGKARRRANAVEPEDPFADEVIVSVNLGEEGHSYTLRDLRTHPVMLEKVRLDPGFVDRLPASVPEKEVLLWVLGRELVRSGDIEAGERAVNASIKYLSETRDYDPDNGRLQSAWGELVNAYRDALRHARRRKPTSGPSPRGRATAR